MWLHTGYPAPAIPSYLSRSVIVMDCLDGDMKVYFNEPSPEAHFLYQVADRATCFYGHFSEKPW